VGEWNKKEKSENQDAFVRGDVDIMVATSAFGMGVDKKDVGMIIHYEISDSLENYIQEAGRAGRDENIEADCYVLFNEEDLSKHFILLNQSKLNIKEIQQTNSEYNEFKNSLTQFKNTIKLKIKILGYNPSNWDIKEELSNNLNSIIEFLSRRINIKTKQKLIWHETSKNNNSSERYNKEYQHFFGYI